MIEYLKIVEILEMHAVLIEKYGGSHGVRDMGALESALYRPQSGYYEDLVSQAAALWESMAQNHPFVDGNKRTAFAAVFTFLDMNGLQIEASSDEAIKFIYGLYDRNEFEYDKLKEWLIKVTS